MNLACVVWAPKIDNPIPINVGVGSLGGDILALGEVLLLTYSL